MTTYLKPGRTRHALHYRLEFGRAESSEVHSFPCDLHGKVDMAKLGAEMREALALCEKGEDGLIPLGIRVYHRHWDEPAVIACNACGKPVTLRSYWENGCACGAGYNGNGQQLDPSYA